MFVDLIIPKNNEKSFIAMAERLGIHGLCFLYKGKPKAADGKNLFSGTYQKANGLFVASINETSVVFGAVIPDQLPRQGFAGVSFSEISNPSKMKNAAKNIRLCRKGKIGIVAASLATKPYEMRSPHDFSSLLICLGMTPGEAKKALSSAAELLGCRNI
ncbi:MAG: RNase P subunit p30 family protein [Candidatus Woesearchaeota archaeon]